MHASARPDTSTSTLMISVSSCQAMNTAANTASAVNAAKALRAHTMATTISSGGAFCGDRGQGVGEPVGAAAGDDEAVDSRAGVGAFPSRASEIGAGRKGLAGTTGTGAATGEDATSPASSSMGSAGGHDVESDWGWSSDILSAGAGNAKGAGGSESSAGSDDAGATGGDEIEADDVSGSAVDAANVALAVRAVGWGAATGGGTGGVSGRGVAAASEEGGAMGDSVTVAAEAGVLTIGAALAALGKGS